MKVYRLLALRLRVGRGRVIGGSRLMSGHFDGLVVHDKYQGIRRGTLHPVVSADPFCTITGAYAGRSRCSSASDGVSKVWTSDRFGAGRYHSIRR